MHLFSLVVAMPPLSNGHHCLSMIGHSSASNRKYVAMEDKKVKGDDYVVTGSGGEKALARHICVQPAQINEILATSAR
jgi:hypothetical protein